MKLLIDLQAAQTDSRHRGIGRQARSLVASLVAQGGAHDIFVMLNAGLEGGFDELRHDFLSTLPAQNVKVFDIPGPVREMEATNLWRMRAAELIREAFVADLRPDILYVSSLFEGVVDNAVTSIGLMDAPYATAATLFDLIPLGDPAAYLAAGFMQRFYYRRAQSLKRADRLIAISQFAKQEAVELLQIPATRIDVALLGSDPSFKRTELAPADAAALRARYGLPRDFIFYVGAIEPRKNIPLIIEGFGKLTPEQRGDVALVFGGRLSEAERAQLLVAAVRYDVDPGRVILPGFIAESDLAPLYTMSRLFVFPSMQEGFGLPPLEAMACGAPVLVARNSSLPEVVGRADQMFGTFDADELAAKMARVLADQAYADELRDWGVRRAGQFSWERAGRETLASLEDLHDRHRAAARSHVAFRAKPRLAFVSPLPSDRSGIATYAGELLRELGCFYDIECIVEGSHVTDPWVIANFPLRDVAFFRRHAATYDRVVYQIGNSAFHAHMFDLLAEIPGVVILHDFFLSGVIDWAGNVGHRPEAEFVQQLYLTHGLPALWLLTREGRHEAALRYPTNQIVFANAHGVIVHSQWSIDRAKEIYGPDVAIRMDRIAHMRTIKPALDKAAARRALGIPADALVLSSFGFVAETKLNDLILEAWQSCSAGHEPGARLILVGDHPLGPWGEAFEESIANLPNAVPVTITGYVSAAQYDLYLAASDIAVQLRHQSRGETSGAILDCMAAGLPLIVNAHGTAAEVDPDTAIVLPDELSAARLANAIDQLAYDPRYRASLGGNAREHIRRFHHPEIVGRAVRDAIERFSGDGDSVRQTRLIGAIGEMFAPTMPTGADFADVSRVIAGSTGWPRQSCLFYDVTLLAQSDAHTGIERVVRAFFAAILVDAPAGLRVEPVRSENGQLVYARRWLTEKFGVRADVLPDTPIEYRPGDTYVCLEWGAYIFPQMVSYLRRFRNLGGRVVVGVHDLLPLKLPHLFPDHIPEAGRVWFSSVLAVSDDLMCVSRSVADDVIAFGQALRPHGGKAVRVNHFPLSADIASSVPTKGLPDGASALLDRLGSQTTFLMVGTVEPRKGHQLVVDAFRRLWANGAEVNLVIVGRQGWEVEGVVQAITASAENGKRLLWLNGVSDEYLERLYAAATALIAASEGEGFGLPLVEAAARGIPLIARDLPVFREVAGEGAYYFDASSGEELATAIGEWMSLHRAGDFPRPDAASAVSWTQSVERFFERLDEVEPYGVIEPAPR